MPLAFLIGLCFSGLGLIMKAMAKSYDFFMYWFTLALTPMMLLSGVFYPIANMPGWLQAISNALPLSTQSQWGARYCSVAGPRAGCCRAGARRLRDRGISRGAAHVPAKTHELAQTAHTRTRPFLMVEPRKVTAPNNYVTIGVRFSTLRSKCSRAFPLPTEKDQGRRRERYGLRLARSPQERHKGRVCLRKDKGTLVRPRIVSSEYWHWPLQPLFICSGRCSRTASWSPR